MLRDGPFSRCPPKGGMIRSLGPQSKDKVYTPPAPPRRAFAHAQVGITDAAFIDLKGMWIEKAVIYGFA